jgi:hypothetical protein
MEFVSTWARLAAQVKILIKKHYGLPMGAFVRFFLNDENFNLTCQQFADRSGPLGCDDFGFLENLAVQTDCHVLLTDLFWTHGPRLGYSLYTCNTYDACFRFWIAMCRP